MSLLKKLHYKVNYPFVLINLPKQLREEMAEMIEFSPFIEEITPSCKFVLCFVFNRIDLINLTSQLIPLVEDDALIWIAYPKKTSKCYKTDLSRDHGWDLLGNFGYEPVSLISLNNDFSIIRFRHVKHIKKMVRLETMKLTKNTPK